MCREWVLMKIIECCGRVLWKWLGSDLPPTCAFTQHYQRDHIAIYYIYYYNNNVHSASKQKKKNMNGKGNNTMMLV